MLIAADENDTGNRKWRRYLEAYNKPCCHRQPDNQHIHIPPSCHLHNYKEHIHRLHSPDSFKQHIHSPDSYKQHIHSPDSYKQHIHSWDSSKLGYINLSDSVSSHRSEQICFSLKGFHFSKNNLVVTVTVILNEIIVISRIVKVGVITRSAKTKGWSL